MKLEELKKKITDGNGKWIVKDGFEFRSENEDGTIHVKCDTENEFGGGFLMASKNGDFTQFYIISSIEIKDINKHLNFCQTLIDILGIGNEVKIGSVVTKEVEVEVIKEVYNPKSEGMIEAYEKLLLGRKVTLEN